jgi:hypothetical protein
MADGRDATYDIAGGRPHKVCICAGQRFTQLRGNLGLADPIVATCDDDDRLPAVLATKYDRLGDFCNRAADCRGCLGTGARWLFEFDDIRIDTGVAQKLRGTQGGGVLGRL